MVEIQQQLQLHHPTHAFVMFCHVLENVTTVITSHTEFAAYYTQHDIDFVYDATSNMYLIGISRQHVLLMAELYNYYATEPIDYAYDAADAYISAGMGMFKSSCGRRIYHAASFNIPEAVLPAIARDLSVF